MSTPNLPPRPEPIALLRRRYEAAIATPVDALAVANGYSAAPSSNPAHVFDTPDGWRLIVSRDQIGPSGATVIHVSMSEFVPHKLSRLVWPDIARGIWRSLSQRPEGALRLVKISDAGVPHFIVRGEQPPQQR